MRRVFDARPSNPSHHTRKCRAKAIYNNSFTVYSAGRRQQRCRKAAVSCVKPFFGVRRPGAALATAMRIATKPRQAKAAPGQPGRRTPK